MFSGKWQIILVFSLVSGVGLMIPTGLLVQALTGKLLFVRQPIPSKRAFPTFLDWVLALGFDALNRLFDAITLLVIAFMIGFVLVCAVTNGMPFDPRIS